MTTHIKALTYPPKIDAVKSYKCCSTIRICKKDVVPGDTLLLHTWAGRPCRSKWDRQQRFKDVNVRRIMLSHGLQAEQIDHKWHPIEDWELYQIFLDDHFFGRWPLTDEPMKLESLKQDIAWMNNRFLSSHPEFSVITWDATELEGR